jgi:hypothetical protein
MKLQLHSDSSGLFHLLESKPVRPGDEIEVLINGKWVKVEYEWSGLPNALAFGVANMEETTVTLNHQVHVRWPR